MLKVGNKIKIIDRYSVFCGEVLTVQREDGKGRFVCTTPKRPRGEYIAYSRDNGRFWVYAKEAQDDD
jgi:hypothetical protein